MSNSLQAFSSRLPHRSSALRRTFVWRPIIPINFAPRRGAILICDFGADPRSTTPSATRPRGVAPEIYKTRRAVVVSPDRFNARQRHDPGLCAVVPFSMTATVPAPASHIFIPTGRYRSITKDVWAKCDLAQAVSHDRLERPRIGGSFVSEYITRFDMILIEDGLRIAFGL